MAIIKALHNHRACTSTYCAVFLDNGSGIVRKGSIHLIRLEAAIKGYEAFHVVNMHCWRAPQLWPSSSPTGGKEFWTGYSAALLHEAGTKQQPGNGIVFQRRRSRSCNCATRGATTNTVKQYTVPANSVIAPDPIPKSGAAIAGYSIIRYPMEDRARTVSSTGRSI